MLAEQVVQGRDLGSLRVGAALGLLQLLRVAEQDQVARGAGAGQDVGQGHLAGLVDEEIVERLLALGGGP